MDPLEMESGPGQINFIPCVKWVRRGVAKTEPDKVKLTQAELQQIIQQTKRDIKEEELKEQEEELAEDDESNEEDMEDEDEEQEEGQEKKEKTKKSPRKAANPEADFNKEYDLDNYDDEEANADGDGRNLLGIGDLVAHANQHDDPFLVEPERDEDDSDVEDLRIKPTDNLILAGHVEGSASILEVYVYNDVDDELYIHHDLLLPSFPLALEWLSYEPGEDTKGSLVAIGTMNPVIEVWDLDLVDGLEPVFTLGSKDAKKVKKSKKKKTATAAEVIGHTDAVLALAWNHHVEHVIASGSVDETVLLWDMSQGKVATALTAHKEKVQALAWHPMEAQSILTGCCDEYVRVFDCRAGDDSVRKWKVSGEVEKVLWNHFNPFQCLAATEQGYVHMIDVRNTDKPLWALQAHDDGINGMNLSTQCPDCLVTVSTDETLKVWDVAEGKPSCILEKNMKLGRLHCVDQCPDAPFVVCVGGDKSSDNMRVMDIREADVVRSRFGARKLQNPLGTADFGFATANEAEPEDEMEAEETLDKMNGMSLGNGGGAEAAPEVSGGAAGKFNKKSKNKKKNKHNKF